MKSLNQPGDIFNIVYASENSEIERYFNCTFNKSSRCYFKKKKKKGSVFGGAQKAEGCRVRTLPGEISCSPACYLLHASARGYHPTAGATKRRCTQRQSGQTYRLPKSDCHAFLSATLAVEGVASSKRKQHRGSPEGQHGRIDDNDAETVREDSHHPVDLWTRGTNYLPSLNAHTQGEHRPLREAPKSRCSYIFEGSKSKEEIAHLRELLSNGSWPCCCWNHPLIQCIYNKAELTLILLQAEEMAGTRNHQL